MAQGPMKQKTCQDSAQPEPVTKKMTFKPNKSSKGARPKGAKEA